jgi:hypothetical protein
VEIQKLTEDFGPSKWIKGPFSNIPGDGWFLLEINPLPPEDEIEKVVSDIVNNKPVRVGYESGKVYHSLNCDSETNHNISKDLKRAIQLLKDETFLVAVLPEGPVGLKKQPVVIGIKPEINYFTFPDHPHLNEDGFYGNLKKFYFPHSFCYKHDHSEFTGDLYNRVLDAFEQVSIWLLRHQIWVATRNLHSKGIWIGKGEPPLPNESFPRFLNPENRCRCGNKIKYKDCHMKADFSKRVEVSFDNKFFNKQHLKEKWLELQKNWYQETYRNNQESFKKIKQALL